jgi:hypothetical protein
VQEIDVYRLRNYYVALVVLLAMLFTAGHVQLGSVDVSKTPLYVHALTAVYVAAILLVPRLSRYPSLLLASVIAVGYLLARSYATDPGAWWSPDTTYLAVLEIVVASLAVVVAQRIAFALREFEDAVANITIGDSTRVKTLDVAQEDIAVEMSRARRYERPLTVTVMAVEPGSIQASLHRVVRDVQRAMMQRYILSGLARVAAQRTRRGDIVVQDTVGNRIIIVSPEASPGQIETLVHRLRDTAEDTLGLPVQLGVAGFPHNALTFEDLISSATGEARVAPEVESGADAVPERVGAGTTRSAAGSAASTRSFTHSTTLQTVDSSHKSLGSLPIDD